MNYASTLLLFFFSLATVKGVAHVQPPCGSVGSLPDSGVGNDLLAVASIPEGWVAVGQGGVILFSPNGERWELASVPTTAPLRGVAWGEDTLVVVGDEGLVLVGSSPFSLSQLPQAVGRRLNAVAWGGGFFVAGGAAGENLLAGVLVRSPDGFRWEDVSPPGLLPVYGVAAGEGGFQAVGWNGSWEKSADGAHWRVENLAGLMHQCTFMLRPSFLFAVAVCPERTVSAGLVVGDQYPGVGVVLSREGEAPWQCTITEMPPHPFRFYAVARNERGFVAAGLGGVASSEDGRHWYPELELPGVFLYGLASKGDTWVAVGEGGRVAVRSCQEFRHPRRSLRPVRE